MSGIEVAGLVLGAIPLILAGLKFYSNGIQVTKRYWRYREEFKSLVVELRCEHTMCVNSINMLLIGVVPPKEMVDFLTNPGGNDPWKEKKFDKKLRERLGTSYDSYMDTITGMNQTANIFKERLKLGPDGKAQFSDEKSFKEGYKRLKFSLNRVDYSDLMAKIRNANSSLHRMTTQTISIESLQNSCKPDRKSIPNFSVINDRAQGFYSALSSGWKCPCQSDHSVSLRLETRMEDVSSDDDHNDSDDEDAMKDPFHILFRYSHTHRTKRVNSPTRTATPWTWDEADVRITLAKQALTSTATLSATTPAYGAKGVRFAKQAQTAVKAAFLPNPNLRSIQDLCSAICTLQKPDRDVCLSLLASEYAKLKYGLLITPLKDPPCDPESWSVSSLRSVLEDNKFTRHDRLRLAITLASSVLQLHETPWLDENWGKDNIFFVEKSGKTMYEHPFVSQHFNPTALPTSAPVPASMSRIIRNQTLYALGVSLIELWYGKALHELHKPEDGELSGDVLVNLMTEWNTADRMVDELYQEAGQKYSDAVRRCIRCDFDRRASSLEDATFQKAVYHGVVSQLKENFDFLY